MSLRALIEFEELFKFSSVMCGERKARKTNFQVKLHVVPSKRWILCAFLLSHAGLILKIFIRSRHCFPSIFRKRKSTALFKDDQFLSFPKVSCKRTQRNISCFWLMFCFLGLVKRIMSRIFIHPLRHFLRLSHKDQPEGTKGKN